MATITKQELYTLVMTLEEWQTLRHALVLYPKDGAIFDKVDALYKDAMFA